MIKQVINRISENFEYLMVATFLGSILGLLVLDSLQQDKVKEYCKKHCKTTSEYFQCLEEL